MSNDNRLLRCKVFVDAEGNAMARYRWSELSVDGHCAHDEDVSAWDDDDIVTLFAELLGVEHDADKAIIEVERE